MKIGRNHPCPCGSGLKFKKCCGSIINKNVISPLSSAIVSERYKANELIRQQQQGLGRPIESAKMGDQQFVIVGKTKYYSQRWKTFPDFLADYLKMVLGEEWGNAEIAKPFSNRHLILQWYDEYCRCQKNYSSSSGVIKSLPITGIVYCYLGLAYNLYLLQHNIELQNRLIIRLKDQANFQGAYYELIIANSLIRAGFDLELEDEADSTSKHCEFLAISKKTGKRYWVEAKMRSVAGLLGKTENDGTKNKDATSELIKHLNKALEKPANSERLIFIDVNTEIGNEKKPLWIEKARKKLAWHEKKIDAAQSAYLVITNIPFHRSLKSRPEGLTILAHGLNIPDFAKVGYYRLSEIYRQRKKYVDIYDIIEAITKYPQLPSTFDGGLPSSLKGKTYNRILIGETYFFEGIAEKEKGLIATVTAVNVDESKKVIYIGTSNGQILEVPISDDELNDYRSHPEAFFGRIEPSPRKKIENKYELFEFFLSSFQNTPKEKKLDSG